MIEQDSAIIQMAMGRIFGMMQRPERRGDAAEYERCKSIILNLIEGTPEDIARASTFGTIQKPKPLSHDYARDYGKGAQGQW